MRPSRRIHPLSAAYIEWLHDVGVDYAWPGIEPVTAGTCRELNLLLSIEHSPYQVIFGEEAYPSVYAKAAYIFCHLTTAHVFENGNKRTACLALEAFLLANSRDLTLLNTELHALAHEVARAGERGARFDAEFARVTQLLDESCVSLKFISRIDQAAYDGLRAERHLIRTHPLNVVGHPLRQRW